MNFGIAYGIALLIAFMIVWFGASKYTKFLFFLTDFLIALPAFFIKISPFIYWDTNRFANLLNNVRSYNAGGISNGLNWALHYSPYATQPLVAFYVWIFSLFQKNGFFFFATAFLFLISISLMIIKAIQYFNLNKNIGIVVQIVVLMTFNFFYEIEGVRNFLSFSIFSTALFIDFNTKEKKWRILCFIFYVIAYMFHPAVLPFIFFRLILLLKSKFLFGVVSIFSLVYTPFLNNILSVFHQLNLGTTIDDMTQTYLYGQNNYNSFTSSTEIIVVSLILVSLIFEVMLFKKQKASTYLSKDYYRFYVLTILFTLGSFLSAQVYLRSIMLVLFLSMPIKSIMFSNLVNTDVSNYTSIKLYRVAICILAIFMFLCWYDWTYSKVFL